MINTICFDLDATLVDSKLVILKTFDHIFKKYLPEHVRPLEQYIEFMGPTLRQTYTKYVDSEEQIQEMISEFVRYYKTIEKDIISLFPTTYETLEYLKNKGYNLCLVSNKFYTSAEGSITYLDIKKFFNNFVCLERQEKPKPDPFPIFQAAKDYNVDVENILMVGDNFVDITCGNRAGAKTALVDFNDWFLDSLKAGPTYTIHELKDLIEILEKENEVK